MLIFFKFFFFLKIQRISRSQHPLLGGVPFVTKYSRMDQVKFVEDSLQKI